MEILFRIIKKVLVTLIFISVFILVAFIFIYLYYKLSCFLFIKDIYIIGGTAFFTFLTILIIATTIDELSNN